MIMCSYSLKGFSDTARDGLVNLYREFTVMQACDGSLFDKRHVSFTNGILRLAGQGRRAGDK